MEVGIKAGQMIHTDNDFLPYHLGVVDRDESHSEYIGFTWLRWARASRQLQLGVK